MKKSTIYILFGLALVDLIFLLYLFSNKESLGIGVMHPLTLGCGVVFILLFMTAVAQLMKKIDEED
jgi:hypothetical protein